MLTREQIENALGGLRAYVNPLEIPVMYEYAQSVMNNPTRQFSPNVVEIGTGNGASVIIWSDATRESSASIITVDDYQGCSTGKFTPDFYQTTQALEKALASLGLIPPLVMIKHDSHETALIWGDDPKPIHLLYIDGDHTYEGCKQDFDLWSPFVPVGGYVLIHDANRPKNCTEPDDNFMMGYPGPTQVAREIDQLPGWQRVETVFSLVVFERMKGQGDD